VHAPEAGNFHRPSDAAAYSNLTARAYVDGFNSLAIFTSYGESACKSVFRNFDVYKSLEQDMEKSGFNQSIVFILCIWRRKSFDF